MYVSTAISYATINLLLQ